MTPTDTASPESADNSSTITGHPEATGNERLDAALALAAGPLGARILPVWWTLGSACGCPAGAKCEKSGKHPIEKGWPELASTDPSQIRKWSAKWPLANIGVATGGGRFVVDVDAPRDGRADGLATIAALEREHGALPATVTGLSGSGGLHLWFNDPRLGRPRIGNKVALAPGIDVRGDGGQVVVAPSRHASGSAYSWISGLAPNEIAVADAPAWIFALIDRGGAKPPVTTSTDPAAPIPIGQRHGFLVRAAAHLRNAGLDESGILDALRNLNARLFTLPQEDADLVQIARDYSRKSSRTLAEDEIVTGAAGAVPFEPLDLVTLACHGIPEPSWLVPGWIVERDVVLVAGLAGKGKTTTTLSLGVALAAGHAWCGIVPPRPIRVLFIDEEAGELETARLAIRLGAHEPAASERLRVVSGAGLSLADPASVARLDATIRAFPGGAAELVILDSVIATFHLEDENAAGPVGARFRTLYSLRDQFGSAFVLIHHPRKSATTAGIRTTDSVELARGSSAFVGSSSAVILAVPGPEKNTLDLRLVKRRGGSLISLRTCYSEDAAGRISIESGGAIENLEGERALEIMLAYLADQGEAKRGVLVAAATLAGCASRTGQRALDDAVEEGSIVRVRRGVYRLGDGLRSGEKTPAGQLDL